MVVNKSVDKLLHLDKLSLQFPDQLSEIISGREFDKWILYPDPDELMRVIEYLDEALNRLPRTGVAFERIHRKLLRICATWMRFPPSHLIRSGALSIDERPFSSGGFSDVYRGEYDGQDVCVKKLRVASASDPEKATKMLYREALTWKWLIHPNIVPLSGVTTLPLQIASMWMPHGDLTVYINASPDPNRVALLIDVANGLDYLHSSGVIHGDLKGPNILVDDSHHARITDFGLAQDVLSGVAIAEGQSVRWTAPEVLHEREKPSKEADVFSFAMVMVEAFTGTFPFNEHPSLAAMMAIMTGERPTRPSHATFTDELWELMQKCWDHDRDKRPQVLDVLQTLNSFATPPPPAITDIDSLLWEIRWYLNLNRADSSNKILDPTHGGCRPLLHALLNHKGLKSYTNETQGQELQDFVELLDEALNHLQITDDLFQKTFHMLHVACSDREVLPVSYFIRGGNFSNGKKSGGAKELSSRHKTIYEGKKVSVAFFNPRSRHAGGVTDKKVYGAIIVWKKSQHPNIVPFIGVLNNVSPSTGTIHGWMKHGRITEYVRKNPQADRIGLLWDVADGLYYLHSCKIIHGDLKGANILVDRDCHARLTGFGLASVVRGNNSLTDLPDSASKVETTWAAPEVSQGGPVTKECDVFAFAVVAVETFTGYPLSIMQYKAAMTAILTGKSPQRPKNMNHDRLWELLRKCWNQDPGERPTAFDLLNFFRALEQQVQRERKPRRAVSFMDFSLRVPAPHPGQPAGDPRKGINRFLGSPRNQAREIERPESAMELNRSEASRALAHPGPTRELESSKKHQPSGLMGEIEPSKPTGRASRSGLVNRVRQSRFVGELKHVESIKKLRHPKLFGSQRSTKKNESSELTGKLGPSMLEKPGPGKLRGDRKPTAREDI